MWTAQPWRSTLSNCIVSWRLKPSCLKKSSLCHFQRGSESWDAGLSRSFLKVNIIRVSTYYCETESDFTCWSALSRPSPRRAQRWRVFAICWELLLPWCRRTDPSWAQGSQSEAWGWRGQCSGEWLPHTWAAKRGQQSPILADLRRTPTDGPDCIHSPCRQWSCL